MFLSKISMLTIIALSTSQPLYGSCVVLDPTAKSTPVPTTYKWKSEKDLILLFEEAENEAVSRQIAASIFTQCLAATNLSEDQIFDGLRISGHTFYSYDYMQESRDCFEQVPLLCSNINVEKLASSYRMLGQIDMSIGNPSSALTMYQAAYDIHMTLRDADLSNMAAYFTSFIAHCAEQSGQFAVALQYVDEGMSIFSIEEYPDLPGLYEIGGDVAVKMGDNSLAISYYEAIFVDFPAYGATDFIRSTPVSLRIKIAKASGFDPYSCDADALAETLSIIENPDYDGMLAKYALSLSLVRCLESYDEKWPAFQLTSRLVDEIDACLVDTLTSSLPAMYKSSLEEMMVESLYKSSKSAFSLNHELDKAQAMADRITTEFITVQSIYVDKASSLGEGQTP